MSKSQTHNQTKGFRFVSLCRFSSSPVQKWLQVCMNVGGTLLSLGGWKRTLPGWPWLSSSFPSSSLLSVRCAVKSDMLPFHQHVFSLSDTSFNSFSGAHLQRDSSQPVSEIREPSVQEIPIPQRRQKCSGKGRRSREVLPPPRCLLFYVQRS